MVDSLVSSRAVGVVPRFGLGELSVTLVVVVVTGGSVTTGSGMVKLPMGGNKEPKLLIAPKGLWKDRSEWVNI